MADSMTKVAQTEPGLASELRRLGKNIDGYSGETIDVAAVLADCVAAAQDHGWKIEEIHSAPEPLLAFARSAARASATPSPYRVYISTGIHGDEPAGPLAVRQLLEEDKWPAEFDIWLCPCLNPAGFAANRRENPEGLDLNREYLNPKATETLSHISWLQSSRHSICACAFTRTGSHTGSTSMN